ncbi:MAG: transposase [Chitinophagales bacterium]|nr:transposase [Chitinophagales bacterium]
MNLGQIYFWTATIYNWQHLLSEDESKDIIVDSMKYLSDMNKIDVFAFVIMPNHIHIIWRIIENGVKETTVGSFLKFTAHQFLKKINTQNSNLLNKYKVIAHNKQHEFWQRDSLAIPLFTKEVAFQKLDYIHNNPIVEKWSLAKEPVDYKYSTASYYENEINNYTFIKDLREEF